MKNHWKVFSVVALQMASALCYAKGLDVVGLSYGGNAQHCQLIFDVTASPKHRVFVINKPERLVIDLQNTGLPSKKLSQPPIKHPLFSSVHYVSNGDHLRVVIGLKQAIDAKHFTLSSNNSDSHHMRVELVSKTTTSNSTPRQMVPKDIKRDSNTMAVNLHHTPVEKPSQLSNVHHVALKATPSTSTYSMVGSHSHQQKSFVIALDAGHGGDDPGAKGQQGTYEKDIVFSIAQRLKKLIDSHPAMKAVMIRKGDYFIGLRDRMQLAREANAELFISIHADAFKDTSARGASVYTLSRSGASSEAANWLAKSENESDLIGGISLNDKEEVLASVLLDLSQSATQEASLHIADHVLKNLETINGLHNITVQKAGFVVLKSPDIPSILVETAFISNPLEEQNLLTASYQNRIAHAIFDGICDFFEKSHREPTHQAISHKVAAL